ncbi:NADH pyrophosphatase [Naganishia albida]|nr:NADH pyrophosphatase [Naganishia albida]
MGDNIINFYAGQPPLNRLSFHRNDTQHMTDHLNASHAKFVLFREGKPLLKVAADPSKGAEDKAETKYDGLYFAEYNEVEDYVGDKSFAVAPSADVGPRTYQSARLPTSAPTLVFLGIDDRPASHPSATPAKIDPKSPQGVPYFAVAIPAPPEPKEGEDVKKGMKGLKQENEFVEPRLAGSSLSPWQANIFAEARAMVDWNERNKFCAGCGSQTYSLWCGWKRGCGSLVGEGRDGMGQDGKVCNSTKGLHNYAYPRTDPVIIMGILNNTGEKMLLGRQKAWPKGMYSCLAGFCEPSESVEDAVRREVMEEAGVAVGQVRYSSSQPWPFPSNLMLGCYGLATSDSEDIHLDLDNELEDARWFSRDEVLDMLSSGGNKIAKDEHKKFEPPANAAGVQEGAALAPAEGKLEVKDKPAGGEKVRYGVPPRTAIAGMLVERWANGELDEIKFSKSAQVSQL